jgi:hypothetical protein
MRFRKLARGHVFPVMPSHSAMHRRSFSRATFMHLIEIVLHAATCARTPDAYYCHCI